MSIHRVAKLAGVSTSTVSRVINNHPRVAPETAAAVRQAMKAINYAPAENRPGPKPAAARALATTHRIALLALGTSESHVAPAFGDLLCGVSRASAEHHLDLVFSHLPDPDQVPARLLDSQVAGLLLHGTAPGAAMAERLRRLPAVWLMGNRSRPGWGDQVMPDGYDVGTLAARYLLGRGHRRLAFLNLDSGHWPFQIYAHAFSSVATEDAAAVVHRVERESEPSPDYWHGYGREAVDELAGRYLAVSPPPTGIFVADALQAALLQPALQSRGVKIAAGAAEVVSCNNEPQYLLGLKPQPAVIDVRPASVGRRGVEQLLWRLDHRAPPERIVTLVEPTLIPPATRA